MSAPRSSVLERIDQLCDRYENSRLAGQRPRIDDYLREVPEAERTVLFRELFKIDLHYRREQRETPTEAEYCQSFPQYSDLIHAVFREEAALRGRRSADAPSTLPFEVEQCPELQGSTREYHPSQQKPSVGQSVADLSHANRWKEWEPGDVILDLYEVTSILGVGGMGKVYKVRHRGWNMDLAVKTPKPDLLTRAGAIEDFNREAETWVNLGLHPHTVTCFYVRQLDGVPRVFAEYIDGASLKDWILSRKLYEGSSKQVLERVLDIAIQFAWGLSYAHEKGLIHQDVKPANVMVTRHGVTKVTDFGLAKACALAEEDVERPPNETILVSCGGMTPAYCSPEQARHHPLSRKTDIWSWGASVLEMFTGKVTWPAGPNAGQALEALLEKGVEDARLPSMPTRLSELLRNCFQKDPESRPRDFPEVITALHEVYFRATGGPYSRDVPRSSRALPDHLNNQAVSLLDLGKKTEAKELWMQALRADPHHIESAYNLGLMLWRSGEMAGEDLLHMLRDFHTSRPDDWLPLYLATQIHLERGDCEEAKKALNEIKQEGFIRDEVRDALSIANDGRTGFWRLLRTFDKGKGDFIAKCLSANGSRALQMEYDNDGLEFRETSTGKKICTFKKYSGKVTSVCLSGDGRRAVSIRRPNNLEKKSHWWDGIDEDYAVIVSVVLLYGGYILVPVIAVWLINAWLDGSVLQLIALPSLWVIALAMYKLLKIIHKRSEILQLWDTCTGRRLRSIKAQTGMITTALCLSGDGRHAVSGNHDGTIQSWETNPSRRFFATGITGCLSTFKGHIGEITSLCLSRNHRYALSAGQDGLIKLWEVATGRCLCVFKGHTNKITSVCFNIDEAYALSGGSDGKVIVWEVSTGRCLHILTGHRGPICSLWMGGDNRHVLSGSEDGILRLWEMSAGYCLRTVEGHRYGPVIALSDDGRYVLSSKAFWELDLKLSGSYLAPMMVSRAVTTETNLSAERDYEETLHRAREAFGSGDILVATNCIRQARSQLGFRRRKEAMQVWSQLYVRLPFKGFQDAWEERSLEGHQALVTSVCLTPDGHYVLSADNDGILKLWELASGTCLCTFKGHHGRVTGVCLSEDGLHALSASTDWSVKVWEVATGRCLHSLAEASFGSSFVCLSPDLSYALSRNEGMTFKLWELASGKCLRTFVGHKGSVISACVSRDWRFAVSASGDQMIKLWELASGRCLRTFKGHYGRVTSVCLTGDERFILSGSDDRTLKVWELGTGRCLRTLEGHAAAIWSVSLTFDGRYALSASEDNTLKVWELGSGRCLHSFPSHTGRVTEVCLSTDGRYALLAIQDASPRLWILDWELEYKEMADWDERAEPYLESFLTCHTPHAREVPEGSVPGEVMSTHLIRKGETIWGEADFQSLLYTLGCAGYGWLRHEGIRNQLKRMASTWRGPPRLARATWLETFFPWG